MQKQDKIFYSVASWNKNVVWIFFVLYIFFWFVFLSLPDDSYRDRFQLKEIGFRFFIQETKILADVHFKRSSTCLSMSMSHDIVLQSAYLLNVSVVYKHEKNYNSPVLIGESFHHQSTNTTVTEMWLPWETFRSWQLCFRLENWNLLVSL